MFFLVCLLRFLFPAAKCSKNLLCCVLLSSALPRAVCRVKLCSSCMPVFLLPRFLAPCTVRVRYALCVAFLIAPRLPPCPAWCAVLSALCCVRRVCCRVCVPTPRPGTVLAGGVRGRRRRRHPACPRQRRRPTPVGSPGRFRVPIGPPARARRRQQRAGARRPACVVSAMRGAASLSTLGLVLAAGRWTVCRSLFISFSVVCVCARAVHMRGVPLWGGGCTACVCGAL